MNRRKPIWYVTCLVLCVLLAHPAFVGAEGLPLGSALPSFVLPVPESPEDMKYLGLKERAPFSISQVAGKLILIEVVNAL